MGQSTPSKKGTSNRYTVRKPALSKSKNSTRTSADLGTLSIRADEQLGKLLELNRDAHHLPAMIGAIVRGDTLAGIGSAGIRKIGSAKPMQVAGPGPYRLVHQGDDGHADRHAGR